MKKSFFFGFALLFCCVGLARTAPPGFRPGAYLWVTSTIDARYDDTLFRPVNTVEPSLEISHMYAGDKVTLCVSGSHRLPNAFYKTIDTCTTGDWIKAGAFALRDSGYYYPENPGHKDAGQTLLLPVNVGDTLPLFYTGLMDTTVFSCYWLHVAPDHNLYLPGNWSWKDARTIFQRLIGRFQPAHPDDEKECNVTRFDIELVPTGFVGIVPAGTIRPHGTRKAVDALGRRARAPRAVRFPTP